MMKVVSLVKGLGSQLKEVSSLLDDLLERRNKSSQTLSNTEVKILCPVLEVDDSYSEDVSIIQPCVTVLKCLSNSLYGGLKPESQEILFKELVCFEAIMVTFRVLLE